MNFSDKKTQMIAGGVAVAAVVIILAVVLLGKKGGQQQTGPGGGAGGGRWAQGGGGQQGAGGAQFAGGGGAQAGGNAGATPTPGQTAPGASEGGPLGTAGSKQAPKPGRPWGALMVGSGENSMPSRPDPLLLLQPPPVPILPEQLTQLPPTNLVEGGVGRFGDEAQTVTDGMIANRRVAGVKFNGGAWAILDNGRDTFVVKPGDVVDGTKITSISRDVIYVTDPDGQKWVVPLRGAGPGGPGQPVNSR